MAYDPGDPRMLFIGAPRPFPAHGPQASPTIPAPTGSGVTYYCAPTSQGSGNGSSPSNAAAFSQTALNAAGQGSVVVLAGSGNPAAPTIYRCTTVPGSITNEYTPRTGQVIIGATTGAELRGSVVIGAGNIATWTTGTQSGTWTINLGTSTAYLTTDGGYQSGGYGTAGGLYPALTYPEDLFWAGVWLDRVPVGTTLAAGQWTGDPSTGILIVYPPTAVDPNTVLTELSTYQNFGVIIQSNGSGDSVTISNLVFNQFSGARQFCQVDLTASAGGSATLSDNSLGTGKGWTIEYCEFKYCHTGAVFAGSYSVVQYNTIHDIGQQAVKGYDESPTVQYNEIYNINQPRQPSGAQWDNTNEAGVGKFNNCHAPRFIGNWCHNIYGPGPWCDYAYWGGEFKWNTMVGFDEQAFRIEMTNKAEVAYNLIINTGRIYDGNGSALDGQSSQALWLAQAAGSSCHHNMILNGASGSGGILVAHQVRSCNWVGSPQDNGVVGDGTELYYSVPSLVGVSVHDNVIQLGAGLGYTGGSFTVSTDFESQGGTLDATISSSATTFTIDQPTPAVSYPADQNLTADPSTYATFTIDSEQIAMTSSTVITVTAGKITYTNMQRGANSTTPATHSAGAGVTIGYWDQSINSMIAATSLSIFDRNVYIVPSAQQSENPNSGGTSAYGDNTRPFRWGYPSTGLPGVFAYATHRYFGPANWKSLAGQDAHSVVAAVGGGNY